ncbi:hypothetical protein COCOBI_06-0750 [Coccomyxa sp. Obi]|nr:hypothetical protein COCOBI_06-0750 [Coccomyxa sp. Obi]
MASWLSQDGYLGLRCLEAKGRFLQARRRAPHKLCFFSSHWGIWEQWQVRACLAPEDCGEVERELHLSPRQLPNFVWHIRVAPVGYASTGMHAHRSGQNRHRGMCEQPPADGILDLSMRLTAGFAQRFHRRPLPAAFAVWRQLVQQRRNCMGQLRKSAKRWQQRWLRDSFHRWRSGAAATRRRRSLLQRGLHRHAARTLAHVFQAWLALAAHRRQLALIGGKLASMHMRRAHTAAFSAWRMEIRCRRRLTVLAERLAAAAAQRRMRAAFLAWADLVLTPDPPAARAPDKGRLIELTPNPLFDMGPRRLELRSPNGCGPTAPFTFPRTSRQCAILGLAAQPSLAELPANLLQRLETAATAAPEAPGEASRRGRCATDARPAAPGLKWPFRFGGYLEPAGTPGVPDQAARQWPDQATLPVQAARFWPDKATLPEGTPTQPGWVQREATPFYTPAADIRCLLAATPLETPAVQQRFNRPSFSVAAANDTTREAHLGDCATVSPQVVAASSSPKQPTPRASSVACIEGRSTAWRQQRQTTAAEQDWHVSLPETCALWEPSMWDCQNAATGGSPGQLSAARPDSALLLPNEATIEEVSISTAEPSVYGPRHGTPAVDSSDRDRRESTGSWNPPTSLAELTPDLSRLAAPAHPAVPPTAESAVADAHAAVPDQLRPAVSASCGWQPPQAVALQFPRHGSAAGSEESRAAAQPPPMPDHASASALQRPLLPDQATPSAAQQLPLPIQASPLLPDQATPSAAQQLPSPLQASPAAAAQLPVPPQTTPSAAEQSPLPGQASTGACPVPSPGAEPSGMSTFSASHCAHGSAELPQKLSEVLTSSVLRGDVLAHTPRLAVQSLHATCTNVARQLAEPGAHRLGLSRSDGALRTCKDIQNAAQHAQHRCALDCGNAEGSRGSGAAVQDVREDWGPAQVLALHSAQRLLCARALSAWLAYVDGRRERWDTLRKAIAFRVQRLQRAVLSALGQHAQQQQQQQQEHRQRCSASQLQRGAVLGSCNRDRGHEASSRGDVASGGVDEASRGPLGGAIALQEEVASEQALHESAAPELAPSGDVMETCRGNATKSLLEGDLNRPQALHGRSQSSMHFDSSLVEQQSSIKPSRSSSSCRLVAEQRAEVPPLATPFQERVAALGGSAQSHKPGAESASPPAVQSLPSSTLPMHEPDEVHQTGECAEPGADGGQSMRLCSDRVQAHASGNSGVVDSGRGIEDGHEAEFLLRAHWDGSLAAVFRAWQEATVLQWQRRLGVAEALMRRRQWRSLAWPFRAWAALADERHRSAVKASSGCIDGAAALDLRVQAFLRECAQRRLSDAFWHWQDTTVWEWKRRRDAVALASLRALGRLLHAWHGLVNQPVGASSEPAHTSQSQTVASGSSRGQTRTFEAPADFAAARSEVGSASMQEAVVHAFHAWRKQAALTSANEQAATGFARGSRLLRALACWRAAAADSQSAVAEFRQRQTRRCAAAALWAWRSRARLLAAVRNARAAIAARLSRACFAAWRRRAAQECGVAAAAARTNARRLQQALSAWRAFAADAGRLRAVQAAIRGAQARRRQAKVLEGFRAAVEQARQRRDAAEAAAVARRCKAAAAAFAAWGQVVAQARDRELAADALSVSAAINRSAAILRSWRQSAAASRESAAAAERLAKQGWQRIMQFVVREWREAVAAGSFEREQAAQTFLRAAAARRAAGVFAAWQEAVIHARTAAAAAEQLAERRRARRLRSAFAAWRIANATLAHARSETLGRFAGKVATARLRAAVAAWSQAAHDANAFRVAAADFLQQRRQRGLRAAFAAWRVANATLAHERSALLDAFHYQAAARRTAAVFAAWCRRVDDARAAAAAAEELGLQAGHRVLRGAFSAWRIASATCAHDRAAALQHFMAQANNRRLRAGLTAWRLDVSEARAAEAAALQRGDRIQRGKMLRFFAAWRAESAEGQSRDNAAVDGFRARSAGGAVGRVLLEWKLAAARAQRATAVAEAMAAASRLRALRGCFALWRLAQRCSAHEEASATETLAATAAERQLTAVLHSWRQVVAKARGATAAADAMSARLHRRSLHETLAAWRTAAFEQAAVEDSAVKLARYSRLEQFFLSWRTAAAGAAAAASAAAGKLQRDAAKRRLADAFQTWRLEAADAAQQVRVMLAAAAERTATRRSGAVVASWRQLAAKRRTRDAAAERLAGVLRLRRLRAVLAAWRDQVAGQRHSRAELLRAFLLRAAAARLQAVFASWRLSVHELDQARRAAQHAAAEARKSRILSMAFQGMVRLARCFYRWAEAAAAHQEGDVAASCTAEAATQTACLSLTTQIASLEEQRLELQRKAAHAPGWAQLSALRQRAASLVEDLTTANAAAAEQLSSKFLLQHASASGAAGFAGNPLLRDSASPSSNSDKGTDEATTPTAWHGASLETLVQKAAGDAMDQSTPHPDCLKPPWHAPVGKLPALRKLRGS